MKRRRWTPEELEIVDRLKHEPPQAIRRELMAAGYHRTEASVYSAAAKARGVVSKYHAAVVEDEPAPERLAPSRRERLVRLAETPGLTVAQYERRKAEILKGDT